MALSFLEYTQARKPLLNVDACVQSNRRNNFLVQVFDFVRAPTRRATFFCPGGRFSKAPETFRARKAIAKSRTLRVQSCFITYSRDEGWFPSYKKFRAYTLHRF